MCSTCSVINKVHRAISLMADSYWLTFKTSGQINRPSLSLWEEKITVVGSVDIPTTHVCLLIITCIGIILNVCMTRQFDDHYLLT